MCIVLYVCYPHGLFCHDCLLSPLYKNDCYLYSHNTENTFINIKNIHYDTVKRYIITQERKLQS